jgi:hypothetical protein
MGYVPFGMIKATLREKHAIRKMLEHLGITHPTRQIAFMSALLDKPFDSSKMSRQDFLTLHSKITNIQNTKDNG